MAFFIISTTATLKDAVTAKIVAFRPKHPKRDQNPCFTPLNETTNILDLCTCMFPPPPPPHQPRVSLVSDFVIDSDQLILFLHVVVFRGPRGNKGSF